MWQDTSWKDIKKKSGFYAGIGSRKTPPEIAQLMTNIARHLASTGWTLRSGGAIGADTAFFDGSGQKHEIFCVDSYITENNFVYDPDYIPQFAHDSVDIYHPVPSALKKNGRNLMARNCLQILGLDGVTPVDFVVCWTPDACKHHEDRTISTGGTGQAISIADTRLIPVFNLANQNDLAEFKEMVLNS